MIRAILIDDEQHCVDRLSRIINEHCKDSILLMDTFSSYEEGLKGIKKLQPELIFLDVQLEDKTGFDLLKDIDNINFDVIFTTAFEKFAVQAFKFSAIDFLLKPVDSDDLLFAIAKLELKKSKNEKIKQFETLFYNLGTKSKKLCVPTITGFEYLNTEDIIRCESDVNYTTIFLKNNMNLMVAKTLKEFEELLSDYGFYRVHNSHLINTSYIKSYNKGKGGYITLTDNKQIEVSTRRKDDFINYLNHFGK